MKYDLLIKNCNVVNAKTSFFGHIGIKDGLIKKILSDDSGVMANRVIDAGGKYVVPGGVDGHTHMMDPGYTEREDFTTGTMAAAKGGITTIVDHHRTIPAVYSAKELSEKIEHLKDKSVVDFGLKGGCSPDNLDKLKDMWDLGITGFKTFTCNLHGVKAMYSDKLLECFNNVKKLDGTILIHSEDDGVLEYMESQLKGQGRKDYLSQYEWRNPLAEKMAVEAVISLARATGVRVIIAHVSQPELLIKIKEARNEGANIYAETGPHYLYLTLEDLKEKGPWVKFTPPMNTIKEIEKMWQLFNEGYVTNIGSDHCPYPKKEKAAGLNNIWNAPNGIPGIETSMRLMLNGVNQGWTTLTRVVEAMSENPAKIYGLYPKKGIIAIGSDADIVIIDMAKEEIISNDNIVSKCGWSPFDGMKIQGVPELVTVRGHIVFEDNMVVGKPGIGQYLHRGKIINPSI